MLDKSCDLAWQCLIQDQSTGVQSLRGNVSKRHSCNVQDPRLAGIIWTGTTTEERVLRQDIRTRFGSRFGKHQICLIGHRLSRMCSRMRYSPRMSVQSLRKKRLSRIMDVLQSLRIGFCWLKGPSREISFIRQLCGRRKCTVCSTLLQEPWNKCPSECIFSRIRRVEDNIKSLGLLRESWVRSCKTVEGEKSNYFLITWVLTLGLSSARHKTTSSLSSVMHRKKSWIG